MRRGASLVSSLGFVWLLAAGLLLFVSVGSAQEADPVASADAEKAEVQEAAAADDSNAARADDSNAAQADDSNAAQVVAAADKSRRRVEEIVVTGRRREEMLQEAPVSVRVFDAEELAARNITRIDEIGFSTANLNFDSSNASNRNARIYIRGVGQDDPRTILDPGVGIYIDGVYIPRAVNALFDLVDYERIEVLRGPQGSLYGKNTIGGVVNLLTTKPGRELGGHARINVGSFNLLETHAAVDIPINIGDFKDMLFTRWTFASATEDGYTTNLLNGEHAGNNRLLAGRFAAQLLPMDTLTMDLTFDWQRQNERDVISKCRIADDEDVLFSTDAMGVVRGSGGPYVIARYMADNFTGGDGTEAFPEECEKSAAAGDLEGFVSPLGKISTDTYGTAFTTAWEATESVLVKNTFGFRYRNDERTGRDADATAADYIAFDPGMENHWHLSNDLNVSATLLENEVDWLKLDLVGGLYFFTEQGQKEETTNILRDIIGGTNDKFNAEIYNTASLLWTAVFLGLPGTPTERVAAANEYMRTALRTGTNALNTRTFSEWSNLSVAGYGHADAHIGEQVTASLGLRYTWERKKRSGDRNNVLCGGVVRDDLPPLVSIPGVIDIPQIDGPRPCAAGEIGTVTPILSQEKDFSQFTPEAGLKYQITDDHMAFFRFARGWKSGGFNQEALTEGRLNGLGQFSEFDPEEVDSYEIGAKTTWFDRQLVVNATLFWNNYTNQQLTSLEADDRGLVTAVIRNVGKSVTRGFELEGMAVPDWDWLPGPSAQMIVSAGVGVTDAFYEDFSGFAFGSVYPVNAACPDLRRPPGQFISSPCNREITTFVDRTIQQSVILQEFDVVPVDNSDLNFKNTPRINVNASFAYQFEVLNEGTLSLRLNYYHQSDVYFDTNNTPYLKADSYGILGGNLAFHIDRTDTRIEFWAKNLLDERFRRGGLNFGDSLGASGIFYGKPRTLGGTITQRF